MKTNDLIRRGFYRVIDDGGAGGSVPPVVTDPPADPGAPAPATDPSTDPPQDPPAGDPPTDPPAALELRAPTPEEIRDYVERNPSSVRDFVQPAQQTATQAQPPAPRLNPWQQAEKEKATYEAQGHVVDLDFVNRRAIEIQDERHQQEIAQVRAMAEVPMYEAQFEREGLPKEAGRNFAYTRQIVAAMPGVAPEAQDMLAKALAVGLDMLGKQTSVAVPAPAAQPPAAAQARPPRQPGAEPPPGAGRQPNGPMIPANQQDNYAKWLREWKQADNADSRKEFLEL